MTRWSPATSAAPRRASPTTQLTYNGSPLEVYFSPQDGSLDQVIAQVNAAQSTIDFAIFFFTEDALRDALIAAHGRGVQIRGLWDELGAANGSSDDEALCAAGIALKIEDTPGKMHHKLMVVDAGGADPRVVTGSLNWSAAGDDRNSENTVIVHDGVTAQAYAAAFAGLWAGMELVTQCNVGSGPGVGGHVYLPLALKAGSGGPVVTPTAVPTTGAGGVRVLCRPVQLRRFRHAHGGAGVFQLLRGAGGRRCAPAGCGWGWGGVREFAGIGWVAGVRGWE